MHVLRRMAHEHRSANSYLNLARLFARTRMVALFPAPPLSPIPKGLYGVAVASVGNHHNDTTLSRPLVLTPSRSTPRSILPFTPLSPLLVEQEYPVWCSERFFSAPSREEDWEECIWQFWLNSYGTLRALSEPNWKVSRNRTRDPEGALPVEVAYSFSDRVTRMTNIIWQQIIHRRLSNRSRHESCVHAARRLKDHSEGETDAKHAHWLKKTCRQVRDRTHPANGLLLNLFLQVMNGRGEKMH